MKADLTMMIQHSPTEGAEEWAIHDYDNMPDMGEWPDIDKLCAIGNAITEAKENDCDDAFRAWLDYDPYNLDNPDNFQNEYIGWYESQRAYAEEVLSSTGELDGLGNLASYFDYDAYARDLFLNDVTEIDAVQGIYVFSR